MGKICPLDRIGLTEFPNSRWGKAHPAHLLMASLHFFLILVLTALTYSIYIVEYLLLLGVINNLHRKLGHNSRNCWHHHWVPPGIHFASMISRHGCCVDGGSTFNGHVSRCAEAAAHTLTWWMIWLLSIGQEQEWGGQARFYKMSAVDGSIANDDDLLGSYPPLSLPLAC